MLYFLSEAHVIGSSLAEYSFPEGEFLFLASVGFKEFPRGHSQFSSPASQMGTPYHPVLTWDVCMLCSPFFIAENLLELWAPHPSMKAILG